MRASNGTRFARSWILAASLWFVLGSCWRMNEVRSQADSTAYLQFIGDARGLELALDGEAPLALAAGGGSGSVEDVRWSLPSGRHLIELYRHGQVVLRRDLYIGPGETRIIEVPK